MINPKKRKYMNLPDQSVFEGEQESYKIKEEMFKLYAPILERM